MKKLILFLFLVSTAFADSVTYIVLVDRTKVPNDEVLGQKLINFGMKKGLQPFQLTRYEINQNPKYALWQLTLTDQAQIDRFNALKTTNKITVIDEIHFITKWDGSIGGWVDNVIPVHRADFPNDYFIVGVSTP